MSNELTALAEELDDAEGSYSFVRGVAVKVASDLRRLAAADSNASAEKSISEMEPNETTIAALCEAEAGASAEARLREAFSPLVDALEKDYVGEVCKDEDPNESVALVSTGPSVLTFGMIYKARAALSPDPHASDCAKQGEPIRNIRVQKDEL